MNAAAAVITIARRRHVATAVAEIDDADQDVQERKQREMRAAGSKLVSLLLHNDYFHMRDTVRHRHTLP